MLDSGDYMRCRSLGQGTDRHLNCGGSPNCPIGLIAPRRRGWQNRAMATRCGRRALTVAASMMLAMASSLAADRAVLSGQVLTNAGQPVDHATVIVYSAGVKKGYSTYCPTCYPDCGKRTLTDANGTFTIDGLNPDLKFRLLVVHEGYMPTFVPNLDPSKTVPKAVLQRRGAVEDPARAVRGRVVD